MMLNYEKTNDDICRQLDMIMASGLFRSSRVMTGMLKFVVKEALAGREDQLKGYTIAVEALGCHSFNVKAQDLAMVRIYAGRLRKLLERYYSAERIEDEVLIDIPKGTYRPRFESLRKA